MDNRIFNVNGKTKEMLLDTLKLVFQQESGFGCKAWKFSKEKGLILCWCEDEESNKLMTSLGAEECLPFVWEWLKGEGAKTVECVDWDADADHDGDNERGWRVYCEDWGSVGNESYAICAIKPVYLWYGK